MTQYAPAQDARDLGLNGLSGLEDNPLNVLLEAASRIFDRAAEVPENYFAPAPAVQTWTPATSFPLGTKIVPTIRNARIYELTGVPLGAGGGAGGGIVGGPEPPQPEEALSGEIEPVWPTEFDAEVQDGNLIWTDRGLEGTVRIFYGDGTDYLRLPPYIPGSLGAVLLPDEIPGIEFIERDGGLIRTVPGAAYALSLVDPAAWNQALYMDRGRRLWDGWPYGVAIQIVARWGWLSTPADVRQSVIQIGVKLYRENDPAAVRVQEIDGQVIREELPPMAALIARKWRERGILFDGV